MRAQSPIRPQPSLLPADLVGQCLELAVECGDAFLDGIELLARGFKLLAGRRKALTLGLHVAVDAVVHDDVFDPLAEAGCGGGLLANLVAVEVGARQERLVVRGGSARHGGQHSNSLK